MSLSTDRAKAFLLDLQQSFQADTLACGPVHKHLLDLGIIPQYSVLVSITPDSGSTWMLQFVDQHRRFRTMDLDSDDVSRTTLESTSMFPRHGRRQTQIEDIAIAEILEELQIGRASDA